MSTKSIYFRLGTFLIPRMNFDPITLILKFTTTIKSTHGMNLIEQEEQFQKLVKQFNRGSLNFIFVIMNVLRKNNKKTLRIDVCVC